MSNTPSTSTSNTEKEEETVQEQNNVTSTEPENTDPKNQDKTPEENNEEKQQQSVEQEETAEPTESVDSLEKLEAENTELKDKLLRLTADMENLRRRTEREKQDMAKYAITNFARDLLTLDDNLNRALSAVPDGATDDDPTLKALVEGMEMTGRELTKVFENNGITKISPKGKIFDPNNHQAMFEIPNPEVPAGTVMEVVAAGFIIEKRVLRPAMVGIAKGGEKPQKTKSTEEPPQSSDEKDNKEPVDKSV